MYVCNWFGTQIRAQLQNKDLFPISLNILEDMVCDYYVALQYQY